MMRILLTTVQVPFIRGGAEFLVDNLYRALTSFHHEVEIIRIPFIEAPPTRIEDHVLVSRLLNLDDCWSGPIDLCIGLKFPAYFIPHYNKVIWMMHQHRGAYDLFNSPFCNMQDNEECREIRDMIRRADNTYLPEAKRIYTIADNVTNRLKRYNHITAKTLYHPCPDYDKFYVKEYENYILMPSRINAAKRQLLALEAMTYVKSDIKLYLSLIHI